MKGKLLDLSGKIDSVSLGAMKIIFWRDKYPERNRDASDLALIIYHYIDAGNIERIYSELSDLLESVKRRPLE